MAELTPMQQIRAARKEAEEQISAILLALWRKTGLRPLGVSLDHVDHYPLSEPGAVPICTTARINLEGP